MVNRYFQQELAYLRDLGAEFSKKHPAIAPMLGGPGGDPDVERLLEGVAFLTALLRQKLDDEFPEVIHGLMQVICPHYLRPIPSTTIVAFRPKPTLKDGRTIPAGIHIASVPVEGTSCRFKTCYNVTVYPLSLLEASFVQPAGRPPFIELTLELKGLRLSDWQPQSLRFFLAGDYHRAANLYVLLRYYLKQIVLAPVDDGASLALSPEALKPVGFSHEESVIPYPTHSFPGYRILQEYFVLPEKFLFLDLVGWEQWRNRGEGSKFKIRFELDGLPFPPPVIKKESFVLFATPVINLFPHDADPIRLDHRKTEYQVRPSGANSGHYYVYSVDNVVGFLQGTAEERAYRPLEAFDSEPQSGPAYHTTYRTATVGEGFDVYLSVAYPPGPGSPALETLSIQLSCTNGVLPESLHRGDVSLPTNSTPEFVEFENIHTPTSYVLPPLGTNLLWRLLSHLSLNHLSLARSENLRAILELYLFPGGHNQPAVLANRKRIAGIEHVASKGAARLVSGVMMRGQEVTLRVRHDHFASQGDLFVFGSVLDHFLGSYASINTYTKLIVEEVVKGDIYQWPARLGDHPLI